MSRYTNEPRVKRFLVVCGAMLLCCAAAKAQTGDAVPKQRIAPVGSPYINFEVGDDRILTPGEAVTVVLQYRDPSNVGMNPLVRLFYGTGGR